MARMTDRQTDRQTDTQTGRHTHTHTFSFINFYSLRNKTNQWRIYQWSSLRGLILLVWNWEINETILSNFVTKIKILAIELSQTFII